MDSRPSQRVASGGWLLVRVASLASVGWIPNWHTHLPGWILGFLSRIHPEGQIASRNQLLLNNFIASTSLSGFRLDSPVKKPVASEMPR
jgi:hypothetical protein